MEAHAWGGYLGAFYRIVGPLQQRLTAMGGSTNRAVAAALHNPRDNKDTMRVVGAHRMGSACSRDAALAVIHICGETRNRQPGPTG